MLDIETFEREGEKERQRGKGEGEMINKTTLIKYSK
jgi:hypothetical protein